MTLQTVNESVIYNRAKYELHDGEIRCESFNDNWDQKKKSRILKWRDVQSKLTFLRANLGRAAARANAQSITITLDELWAIGEKQEWRCAYTGIPLEFTRGGNFGFNTNPNSCTIDRIDSDKPYSRKNVQLITWIANCSKNSMTHDQYIDLCKRVVEHNK